MSQMKALHWFLIAFLALEVVVHSYLLIREISFRS
jgi:hypothetical protein